MSAMNNMLADILKKALGPEVGALMTEENMTKFKANAEALVMELRDGIANCQRQNELILAALERIESNDGRNDSGKPAARKRADISGGASTDTPT